MWHALDERAPHDRRGLGTDALALHNGCMQARRLQSRLRQPNPEWRARSALAIALLGAGACAAAPHGSASARSLPRARAHAPRTHQIDVEHYDLELALDPASRRIEATCRVRLWPASGVARIDRVALDLDGLDVRRVRDRAGSELTFTRQGEELAITLAQPLARGRFEELSIDYGGTPRRGLWFTDVEHGVATQVYTQGECEDARGWFPCIDDPAERATSSLSVTMPAGWTSLAAGARVEHAEPVDAAGHVRERWRTDFPHPAYLTTLVAGEFATHEELWRGKPLVYLADPKLESSMAASFARTKDILEFFSRTTALRYPYPKYGQACVASFPFGGMENISATTLTDATLGDERSRNDGNSDGLVAHEAAHQWFGDWLTCADWSHIWLNEGFATYFGALWVEHDEGVDEYRAQMRRIQDAALAGDSGAKQRPVVWNVYRQPMDLFFTGHVYQGGAARLHLLRSMLGDEAFLRGIALYVGRNRARAVVSDDLRLALEETSGRELTRFFEQWLYAPGHPRITTSWSYDADRKLVKLAVEQTQDTRGGVPEAFEAPVDVEIALPPGRSGQPEKTVQRIELAQRRQRFELPCSARPQWVLFDVHGALLAERNDLKEPREWLAVLRQSDDPGFRRDALRALAKLAEANAGDERARLDQAFREVAQADRSSLVRETAVELLAKRHDAPTQAVLQSIATSDPRSAVRVAAFNALVARAGEAPLAAELARFAEREFDAGWSWGSMAAAARLRASAAPEDAYEWIQQRRAIDSPHATLEARLVEVLGSLDEPRVDDELERSARDAGESVPVRSAAAAQLARAALQRRSAVDTLLSLLDEPDFRLRRAAIGALKRNLEPRVRERLRSLHAGCVIVQERRALEDALEPPAGAVE